MSDNTSFASINIGLVFGGKRSQLSKFHLGKNLHLMRGQYRRKKTFFYKGLCCCQASSTWKCLKTPHPGVYFSKLSIHKMLTYHYCNCQQTWIQVRWHEILFSRRPEITRPHWELSELSAQIKAMVKFICCVKMWLRGATSN